MEHKRKEFSADELAEGTRCGEEVCIRPEEGKWGGGYKVSQKKKKRAIDVAFIRKPTSDFN